MGKNARGKPRGPYKPPGVARERTPIHELKDGKETGRFLARWVDTDGVERQAEIWKTKTAAQAATRAVVDEANSAPRATSVASVEVRHEVREGDTLPSPEGVGDHPDAPGTIADYGVAAAWPYRAKDSRRTSETHADRVRRVARFLPLRGNLSPFKLTLAHCQAAQDEMLMAGLSPGVVDGSFESLSALARKLREVGYEVPNPAAHVRVQAGDGRISDEKLEMEGHHVVERDHLHLAVDLAPTVLRPLLLTPATSSARTAELLAASHREWDPAQEMMYFHETIHPRGELQPWTKGRRRFRANKAKRGRWALWPRALQEMWLDGPLVYLDGYLMHSPRGKFWHHTNFYRRCWNDALKPAEDEGVPHFTPYDLRHTFVTTLLDADVPRFVVAAWAGHDLSSTLGKSSSTDLGDRLEAANTLMAHYAHLTDLWRPYGLSVVTSLLLNTKMPLLSERPGGM